MNKKFWNFKVNASTKTGELYLYGPISSSSWWDDVVSPKSFKKDLDDLGDVSEIHVYINSGGGDVFAGQAIHSMLKRHKAKIIMHVDGLAASIASVILMAGDVIYMPSNAMMMIHNPWTYMAGNAEELRKMADDLDKIRETLIAAYIDKSGINRDELIKLLNDETWLTAEEALSYGFIDEIDNSKELAASLNETNLVINGVNIDMTRYTKQPTLAFMKENLKAKALDNKNTGNEGSENSMEFDVKSLSKEAQEHIASLETKIIDLEAKLTEKEGQEQKTASTETDIYAGLPENIVALMKKQASDLEAANKEIERINNEKLENQFKAKAESFKFVPGLTAEFGKELLAMSKACPDAYAKLEKLLEDVNAAMEKGPVLSEVGSSAAPSAANTADEVYAKIESMAKKLVDEGKAANITEAKEKVYATEEGKQLKIQYNKLSKQ